ncbi:hypothetical protein EVAR_56622_1 [Eumeta japonica]|uniref:ABC transmembrane type-1 domain-containing protein n=1 Tax=Eumeta variegata TaxID=151549 RepID=A0A4C1XH17_EUMVA|nr:hypothetical protein EVAR_56622_1 [Eumeta japonica]
MNEMVIDLMSSRWSFKLFHKGYKVGLTVNELCRARVGDQSERLGDSLEAAWRQELHSAKQNGSKPSLSRAIIRTFWVQYMLCGLFVGLLFIVLWPLIPYTLALFIGYFSGEKTPEAYRNAHIHNFVMNALSITTSLILNHLYLSQGGVGMRIRIACCSLIYRKILKLDRTGLSKTESGQVINLMSNDVNRFDMVALFLHYLWVMPIVVPVVCYLVWQHVQWATLSALAVIFLQSVVVQAKRAGQLVYTYTNCECKVWNALGFGAWSDCSVRRMGGPALAPGIKIAAPVLRPVRIVYLQ